MSNKKMLALIVATVVAMMPVGLFAQTATVTGTVTDESTGEPLPGANIFIELTNLGAATDVNGSYSFTVPSEAVQGQEVRLTARFIGYHGESVTIILQAGEITQDFSLAEDVLDMEAIVVTGVAEATPKANLPFSAVSVADELVEMAPAVSAVQGLQGKAPGVRVVKGTGRPGDGVSVNLRAPTKIDVTGRNRTQEPLYIVDGVILAANQVDIDALDTESIEILSGAAASSLYGSRAANGVIQIRTKRGNELPLGETRIRIRNEVGRNQLGKEVKLNKHHFYKMDAANQKYVDADGNEVDFSEAVVDADKMQDNPFPGTHYDHLDIYFDPGGFSTNSVSISQHSPTTNYRLSFSNLQESGVMKFMEGYGRKNVRVNLDHKVRRGLNLSMSGYYANSSRDDPQTAVNPFYSLMFVYPNVDLEKINPETGDYFIQPDARTLEENPLFALKNAEEEDRRQRIMGSFSLNYSPVQWFSLEGNFSFDRSDRYSSEYYPKGYETIDATTLNDGQYIKVNSYDQAINSSITTSFHRQFGSLFARTKLRALYESDYYDYTYTEGNKLTVQGVRDLGNVEGEKDINSTIEEVGALGYYSITSLQYSDRYIADFMVRRDGSSLFGADEQWHAYYRASLAWRLSQEPWWFVDAINQFKLRFSLGTAGGRPRFNAQYETFDVTAGSVSKETLGNTELKPEFSTETELGVEMAFLDRYSLEITYANNITEDQLLEVPLAAYYGFSTQWRNAGILKSTILEASLQAFILRGRDISWSAGLVYDQSRNEITEFDLPAFRFGPGNAFYVRKGEVFGSMYGHRWLTSKDELQTHSDGEYKDYAGQFQVNDEGYLVPVGTGNSWQDGIGKELWGTKVEFDGADDLKWGMPIVYDDPDDGTHNKIGDVIPDFNVGFNSTFRWKGFQAYVLFDAQIGGDIYNNTRQWPYRELRHGDNDQSGKPDDEKKPFDYYAALYDVNAVNSHFVEEGTYLKLREVTLRYNFDRRTLQSLFGETLGGVFNRVTIGVIGRNLLTWTDYSGWDPEVGQEDATTFRYDGFRYPQYRTITGIFEVEF